MAVRCLVSPPINIHKPSPTNKNTFTNNRVMMLSHTHNFSSLNTTKPPLLQITSSFNNKVFEDEAKGIVCYRDINGEIICEGYDEGPRHQPQDLTRINCINHRDAKIVDLLQRSLRQMLEGVEINCIGEDDSGATDFHSNGFNTFC